VTNIGHAASEIIATLDGFSATDGRFNVNLVAGTRGCNGSGEFRRSTTGPAYVAHLFPYLSYTPMNKTQIVFASALAAASLWTAQPAAAQNFLLPSTPEKGVWVEASHTSFKRFEADLPSTVWYVSGRLPLTSSVRAVVDLPFSYARMDLFEDGVQTSSVFGNPYLGLEFAASRQMLLEVGTRVPLTTADPTTFADMVAFLADPQRPEAFLEDLVPLTVATTFRQNFGSGLGVRARGGVTGLIHTGEESRDPDAALDYGVMGTYTAGIAQVGLGVTGRWYATSDEGGFAESSLHHAGLSADVRLGRVRPGISLRVPLDADHREVVKSTVGVYLQVPVR
jgi:hypothetical protein